MNKWLKRVLYFLLFLFVLINIVAAFHAYKFTHFYEQEYVKAKRPEDMNGWEKAKTVLFGVDYAKRPITETPSSPFSDFTVTTKDGLRLKGWYIPVDSSIGTVLMFHGHGGTRSGVLAEAKAFRSMGYNVCTIDFRAHGTSEGNVCTIGFRESADVKAAYDYVADMGEDNIVMWGISLGAATIAKAIQDYPTMKPSKVILEMPFGTLVDAVKGRLRLMHLPEQPLAGLLTFWGGAEQGFWAFGHRPQEYVRSIKVPVLLQWGVNDTRVSQAETDAVFANIPVAEKTFVAYENSGHESLMKKEPAKWITQVSAFLAK